MKTKYKHIYFRNMSQYYPRRKTSTYMCVNNSSEVMLGTIQWESGWRQYIFTPENEGGVYIFAASCLDDISHFIGQLTAQRIADKKTIKRISKIED